MIKGPPLPSGDGKIDYDDEFLLLMARRIMDSDEGIGAGSADGEESLRHAFKVFDR